ncbi:MAG: T9SS type A sorting domain-containing protein [Flavobacteriales bacterium]|jgi:hypothetical protein|nr:T9SS type A sorting domain-containing protein [Flavobacteriales bacterium]
MKIKITLLLAFTSVIAFSQITVTDADLLGVGDIIYLADDESTIVNIGSAGQNQTWDFSALQSMDSWSMEVVDPTTTPFDQLYPNANLCIIDDGDFIYCNKSTSGVSMLGIGDSVYQQALTVIPLPLSYSFSYTEGPILVLDSLIGGPMVDLLLTSQGLSAALLTFGAAHVADSLSIKLEMTTSFNVDGEGVISIPMGSFDALRVMIERTTVTDISVYCIDTNGGANSDWYPVPFGNPETEKSCQWFSNNINTKFALAEVILDSVGNPETGTTFLTTSINSLDNIEVSHINIFPIPSTYNVTITSESNEEVNAILSDINGREVKRFEFTNSITLNLSDLEKGTYLLNLKTNKDILTKKLIIE